MNIFVQKVGDTSATQVTADTVRDISGYFWKGDTVVLKWSNIDYQTYDFFYTLENDGSGNPFANQVKVKSNVTGGIGVFAGYATRYYSIKVPK